jgi:hypothetical protein
MEKSNHLDDGRFQTQMTGVPQEIDHVSRQIGASE